MNPLILTILVAATFLLLSLTSPKHTSIAMAGDQYGSCQKKCATQKQACMARPGGDKKCGKKKKKCMKKCK